MATASLSEKVLLIEEGFRRRRIPHAFGGAIALAYYATPRATVDIDVNVFVPVERADEVLSLLERLGTKITRYAAEDLLIFKALFDRDKDWRDIEELVYAMADELDAVYARGWLERIAGAPDPRTRRLCEVRDRYA